MIMTLKDFFLSITLAAVSFSSKLWRCSSKVEWGSQCFILTSVCLSEPPDLPSVTSDLWQGPHVVHWVSNLLHHSSSDSCVCVCVWAYSLSLRLCVCCRKPPTLTLKAFCTSELSRNINNAWAVDLFVFIHRVKQIYSSAALCVRATVQHLQLICFQLLQWWSHSEVCGLRGMLKNQLWLDVALFFTIQSDFPLKFILADLFHIICIAFITQTFYKSRGHIKASYTLCFFKSICENKIRSDLLASGAGFLCLLNIACWKADTSRGDAVASLKCKLLYLRLQRMKAFGAALISVDSLISQDMLHFLLPVT